ncbi:MAG: hypothetical protein HYS74_02650 [Parcubacteria group bacterium]|nr:hypothetical protein [Parcubacteria group bacterium]
METLSKLFDSPARVKIMRLFLLNPHEVFAVGEVRLKSKVESQIARRELARLHSVGFIKRQSVIRKIQKKRGKNAATAKKWVRGLALDERFPYLEPLRALLTSTRTFDRRSVISRFRGAGNIKLLIITGVFIHADYSRIDLLIVGDALKRKNILPAMRLLEAEMGKELRYAVFPTTEFLYRIGIYDKFVRDILDFPHEKLIDRIGVPPLLPR